MPNLKWSFTIRDAATNLIYSSDKMNNDYLIENSIGKHTLKIKLENLLLPGKYLLSGELREGTGIFFVGYSNKKSFKVKANEKNKNGRGIIYIEHEVLKNE